MTALHSAFEATFKILIVSLEMSKPVFKTAWTLN